MRLDGFFARFVSPDPNRFVNGRDEDFAVSDLARLGGLDDGSGGRFHHGIAEDDFDFDLGQEVHRVFAAAVDFRVTFLAAEALDLAYRHALHADVGEGFFHFLQFEGFDDRFDFFH